jgi:hypothetical protein
MVNDKEKQPGKANYELPEENTRKKKKPSGLRPAGCIKKKQTVQEFNPLPA